MFASHLTKAQEGMAAVMSNLSLLECRFGEGGDLWGPHWDSILAPYVNLVPHIHTINHPNSVFPMCEFAVLIIGS